jgi:hypothetical protein
MRPASTNKLPIVISPIAKGIIDAPNERQPRALDAPLSATRKVIVKEWRACPVARLTLDYSIKFYRQLKGIFKVNRRRGDLGLGVRAAPVLIGRPYQEFLWYQPMQDSADQKERS